MRNLIAVAALMLTAAPSLAQTTPTPAPDGSIVVSPDQNGQSLDARVGADVTVQLQRNASAGTRWLLASKPDFLGDPQEAEAAPASARPVLGAPSWQLFIFPVSDAGDGVLTFEKHDRAGATIETFTVTINATAQ